LEERVDSGKMSGTPSQNQWKTMGSKNLWEPMADSGIPPTRTIESQWQSKVEKKKMK
jgi:hypothetical protein